MQVPTSDYVTEKDLARYCELMDAIAALLSKSQPTDQDAAQLNDLCKELQSMQRKGVTPQLNDMINLLFTFMQGAGADPNTGDFLITPSAIQALGGLTAEQTKITINGQQLTLVEALQAASDPNFDPTATVKLGDMLLDLSNSVFADYDATLKELQEQIEISKTAINNLKALQDILNMVTLPDQPDINVLNPTSWNQIPPDVQKILKEKFPEYFTVDPSVSKGDLDKLIKEAESGANYYQYLTDKQKKQLEMYYTSPDQKGNLPINASKYDKKNPPGKITFDILPKELRKDFEATIKTAVTPRTSEPSDFAAIQKWIKSNPNEYAGYIEDYYKEGISFVPTPKPDSITATNDLLKARDNLKEQFDKLDAMAKDPNVTPPVSTDTGSAYATLKKVLEDIETYLPSSTYPYGSTLTQTGTDYSVVTANGVSTPITAAQVNKDICAYISAGHDTTSSINQGIDNAVTANQNLSQTVSDQIKAENMNFQTMYDILSQVMKMLNDIIMSSSKFGR